MRHWHLVGWIWDVITSPDFYPSTERPEISNWVRVCVGWWPRKNNAMPRRPLLECNTTNCCTSRQLKASKLSQPKHGRGSKPASSQGPNYPDLDAIYVSGKLPGEKQSRPQVLTVCSVPMISPRDCRIKRSWILL